MTEPDDRTGLTASDFLEMDEALQRLESNAHSKDMGKVSGDLLAYVIKQVADMSPDERFVNYMAVGGLLKGMAYLLSDTPDGTPTRCQDLEKVGKDLTGDSDTD